MPTSDDLARYRYFRGRAVARCIFWRAAIALGDQVIRGAMVTVEEKRALLKREQKILLKLRIQRVTGEYPRSDH